MKTLKVVDGDFVLTSDKRFEIIEGEEAIAQRLRNIFNLALGEFFLEPDEGVNWFKILEKPFDLNFAKSEVLKALNREPRVQEIRTLNIDFDNKQRLATINYDITVDNRNLTGEEQVFLG